MRKRTSQVNLENFRKKPKSFRLKPLAAIVASALILTACGSDKEAQLEIEKNFSFKTISSYSCFGANPCSLWR